MAWNFIAPNVGLMVYKRLYTEDAIKCKIKFAPAQNNEKEKLFIDIPKDAKVTPFDIFYKAIFANTLKDYTQIENNAASHYFNLATTYPGLLCGSGYTHDSNAKGDIKIGFYFDHTTGQPVIPGSSIKGVLKSVFENEKDQTDQTSLDTIKFFLEEVKKKCTDEQNRNAWENILKNIDIEGLKRLKEGIFGKQDAEGKDVFFDAAINIEETGKSKKFLSSDFITHHPDPLKNPTPLMFIKVLPGITFEFRFKLTDSTMEIKSNNGVREISLKADQKAQLFQEIILTLGIGAKTNVGYGQFETTISKNNQTAKNQNSLHKNTDDIKKSYVNKFPPAAIPLLKKDKWFEGEVFERVGEYFGIKFSVSNQECVVYKKQSNKLNLNIGIKVKVICANNYTQQNHNLSVKNFTK